MLIMQMDHIFSAEDFVEKYEKNTLFVSLVLVLLQAEEEGFKNTAPTEVLTHFWWKAVAHWQVDEFLQFYKLLMTTSVPKPMLN